MGANDACQQERIMKTLKIMSLVLLMSSSGMSQDHFDTVVSKSLSFEREIPQLKNGERPSYYRNKAVVEKMIGLQSLEGGFDSLEIRIWYGYARTDSSQLVILARDKKMWSAKLYTFVYELDQNGSKVQSMNKRQRSANPRFGWGQFIDTLFELSVCTLPDQYKIADYPEYTDGNSVIVEVATKQIYRIYSYKEPFRAQTETIYARKIEQALNLIESELGFKQFREF
jgi:hypothetical protein